MDFRLDICVLLTLFLVATRVLSVRSFKADDQIACGATEIESISRRVIGGQEAKHGAWPWIVLLAEQGYHICGGSILNERIILTASHCFDGQLSEIPSRWTVYTGKYHVNQADSTQTSHRVERIIRHPDYMNTTLRHDIALMVLKEPICLPPTYRRVVPINTLCYTAGWGETRGTADPYTLNQVALPLLHDYWCSRPDWYGSTFIPRLTFCAGYAGGGKDSCSGDSGGPYACKVNGTWYQQGIVSWGFDCGLPKWPGVFTDVSKYRNWVVEAMAKAGFPLNPV